MTGRLDQAVAAAERANDLSGRMPATLGFLGMCYGLAGRAADARQLLEELEARRRVTYVPAFSLGVAHLSLGELDQGLECMVRGIEERDPIYVISLKSEPLHDPLRSHPTFHAVLRKMNLEP